jgi:hypothetical protein
LQEADPKVCKQIDNGAAYGMTAVHNPYKLPLNFQLTAVFIWKQDGSTDNKYGIEEKR